MVKRKKGFTLIELLVVITIIAVLAAILFPVFLIARAKAREIGCLSNLKQWGGVFKMYQNDWDGRYPYTATPANPTMGGSILIGLLTNSPSTDPAIYSATFWKQYLETWTIKLEPYVRYRLVATVLSGGATSGRSQGIMRCKDIDKDWRVRLISKDEAGYGYNFLYLGLPFKAYGIVGSPPDDASNNPYGLGLGNGEFGGQAPKVSSVKSPSETICLVENAHIWAFPPYEALPPYPDQGVAWTSGNVYIRPRHARHTKSNVMWADGHASAVETRYLVRKNVTFGDYDSSKPMNKQLRYVGVADTNKLWDLE